MEIPDNFLNLIVFLGKLDNLHEYNLNNQKFILRLNKEYIQSTINLVCNNLVLGIFYSHWKYFMAFKKIITEKENYFNFRILIFNVDEKIYINLYVNKEYIQNIYNSDDLIVPLTLSDFFIGVKIILVILLLIII